MNSSSSMKESRDPIYLNWLRKRKNKTIEKRTEDGTIEETKILPLPEQVNPVSPFAKYCGRCISIVLAIISFVFLLYFLFDYVMPFNTYCPSYLDRECNGHGTCNMGNCECELLFSGQACTNTQIPGYNLIDNTECNGNGFSYPIILPVPSCLQSEGGDWKSPNCTQWTEYVQSLISNVGGDASQVFDYAITIPTCLCNPGWGQFDCSGTACPINENGAICNNQGNTSVGYIYNATNAGNGCQCNSLFAFYEEQYASIFTENITQYLVTEYNVEYNLRYCGQIYQAINETSGEPIPNVILAYTIPSDYQCYCDISWSGIACELGRCPSTNHHACSGAGDPTHGQGIQPNTTSSTSITGLHCDIQCINTDYKSCSNKCVYNGNDNFEIINQAQYCISPNICPSTHPIRCIDGSCVAFPNKGTNADTCAIGYTYGSIDYGQFQQAITIFACPNITSYIYLQQCLQNTTKLTQFTGQYDYSDGAYIYPYSPPIIIDLGSPLIYFQLVSTQSGLNITTWDGQTINFNSDGFVSGTFIYQNDGLWFQPIYNQLILQRNGNLYYVYPMPWNYSSNILFNSSWGSVRVTNIQAQQTFVLDAISSNIINVTFIGTQSQILQGMLIAVNVTGSTSQQPLWYFPTTGNQVPNTNCLAVPTQCAWYVSPDLSIVRNLQSTLFLCNSTNGPIIQSVQCIYSYSSFSKQIQSFTYSWITQLVVTSELSIPLSISSFDYYELNNTFRDSWPFSLQWNLPTLDITESILLQDVVFLTQDRITYPCVCGSSGYIQNQSTLNAAWYSDTINREITTNNVQLGDYVVAANISLGDPNLFRGEIIAYDDATLQVLDNRLNLLLSTYMYDARKISQYEYVSGLPDCELILFPFRCPDGYCSTSTTEIFIVNVTCNCTYYDPIVNCTCMDDPDEVIQAYNWTCQCNTAIQNGQGQCSCGYPSTGEFERNLLSELQLLTNQGCSCILFNLDESDYQNTSLIIYDQDVFTFSLDQIPYSITIWTIGPHCVYSSFFIYASSFLFSYKNVEIDYVSSSIRINSTTCEHWLTIYYPQDPAFNNITIFSNETITQAVLQFTTYGISIGQTLDIPEITASSNNENASNINLLNNASYWLASNDLRQYPTWIQMKFNNQYFVNYTSVVFYQLGVSAGNFTKLSQRVYLEASNDEINWIVLGSWGGYVQQGGWLEKTLLLNLTMESFSTYRLLNPGGLFGIRQWQLFTNQICDCNDNSHLVLNLNSTDGLVSIQDQLDQIEFFYNYTSINGTCIAINNCTLLNRNVTYNGECNDAIYQAYLMGIEKDFNPTLISNINTSAILVGFNETPIDYTIINHVTTGLGTFPYDILEFAVNSTYVNTTEQLIANYYNWYKETLFPWVNYTQYNSYIVYLFQGTNQLILSNSIDDVQWIPNTYNITVTRILPSYGTLVQDGVACIPGYDAYDCGSSNRLLPIMAGYGCTLTPLQYMLQYQINNKTILISKSYYMSNITQITSYWTAFFGNIPLTRKETRLQLNNCPTQTCPLSTPWKCSNGGCAVNEASCGNLYDCPGNGCIELTDISLTSPGYACACRPGFAGDACQYGAAQPATPNLNIYQGAIPAALALRCGGPPPFRIKQPVLDVGQIYTIEELDQINMRLRGSCGPKSPLDMGYHCVMPIAAPFGLPVILQITTPNQSPLLPPIITNQYCPCMRLHYDGSLKFMYNDYDGEINVFTGEKNWICYPNPNGGPCITYSWTSICSYNDVPYLCPTGYCVPDSTYCSQASLLHPPCNGRGQCRSDMSCKCNAGYSTFAITDEFTSSIILPYNPDPTVWETNDNWRNYPQQQCTARNCELNNCQVPMGCFTGTVSLGFSDKQIVCSKSSGQFCAQSQTDCEAGLNLTPLLVCSGNGIAQVKDYSGEEYCQCGTPISPLMNITGVSQITQLQPNGYGGPFCTEYYADLTIPLVYSTYNYESGQPYYSLITGLPLPGLWLQGITILGPSPEDKLLWSRCCPGIDRLEMCNMVPCNVPPNINCLTPQECLSISQTAPLVYPCNNHGTARADGSCECTGSVTEGTGYTYDYTEFSYQGCYKYVSCPISVISGTRCNFLPAWSNPKIWLNNPFPLINYEEQQWFTCGPGGGLGEYSNVTHLQDISVNINNYQNNLQQQLANVATSVLAAQASLAGCICVYPTDTQYDKCCMIDNGINYVYKQNYNRPYLLSISIPQYPQLTNNVLQSIVDTSGSQGNLVVINPPGTIIKVYLNNPMITTLSAVRIFGLGNSTYTFTSTLLPTLMPTTSPTTNNPSTPAPSTIHPTTLSPTIKPTTSAPTPEPTITTVCASASLLYDGLPYLEWRLGTIDELGGAHFCGPTYKCISSHTYPQYNQNCGVKANTQQCLSYKETTCTNAGNVWWPPGSNNYLYQGCLAGTSVDPDGCTCCQQVGSYSQIVNGEVDITITTTSPTSIVLGQIRFYGFTSEALPFPSGFNSILSNEYPSNGCQDYNYILDYAPGGGDQSYYLPLFNETEPFDNSVWFYAVGQTNIPSTFNPIQVSRQNAFNICNLTGGWLAVTDQTYQATINTPILTDLQSVCQTIGVSNIQGSTGAQCWINAASAYYNDSITQRNELFNPNTCTMYGCYMVNPTSNQVPGFYFYANNSYDYVNPVYGQTSFYALNDQIGLQNQQSNRNLWLWDITPSSANIVPVFLRFYNDAGCTKDIYVDARPTQMFYHGGGNQRASFLYGEIISLETTGFICGSDSGFLTADDNKWTAQKIVVFEAYSTTNGANPLTQRTVTIAFTDCIEVQNSQADNNIFADLNYATNFLGYPGLYSSANCQSSSRSGCYNLAPSTCSLTWGHTFTNSTFTCSTTNFCGYYYSGIQNEIAAGFMVVLPYDQTVGGVGSNVQLTYASMTIQNLQSSTGTVGRDFVFGQDIQYSPMSIYLQQVMTITGTTGGYNANQNLPLYVNGVEITPSIPILFSNGMVTSFQQTFNGYGTLMSDAIQLFPNILPCTECPLQLENQYLWDQLAYPLQGNTDTSWADIFTGPQSNIVISIDPTGNGIFDTSNLIIFTWPTSTNPALNYNIQLYVHQTCFINTKNINTNPLWVQWYIPSCLVISATSGGLETIFCNANAYTMCMFDYTKYAILPGYQCDICGCSTKLGGSPQPLQNCFVDNPLANSSANPFDYQVLAAYESGTLDLFAESINMQSTSINFNNYSVITGSSSWWLQWSANFSNRAGQTSDGIQPQVNWCDASITGNWPINCGVQTNPLTGLKVQRVASNTIYCNLLIDLPPPSLMNPSNIPPILLPVNQSASYTNPTCGPNVILSSYYTNDKYGVLQSDLSVYSTIGQLTSTFIQLIVSTPYTTWYNGGKTNTQYKFQWYQPAIISGQYTLNPCSSCRNPIMEVFIYPLNPDYLPPSPILAQNISMVVSSNVQSYQLEFNVTEDDTGLLIVNGITYPEIVFRGIGFRFYNLVQGSSIILFNPTITDNTTRLQCTTRQAPIWYEPPVAIDSTAPIPICIITPEDQLANPGLAAGECLCDYSQGGQACDCPSINGYTCSSWADSGTGLLAPDGIIYSSGSQTEQGCIHYDLSSITGLYEGSDCKTVNIGVSSQVLMNPTSAFDYPSVYIETLPSDGAYVFQSFTNPTQIPLSYLNVTNSCINEGMFLPYYYTGDELEQFVLTSVGNTPVFMSINITASNSTIWPWISTIEPSYFIYNEPTIEYGVQGNCYTSIICTIANYNNYAYSGSVSATADNFLIDGNTLVSSSTTTSGTLTWSVDSSLQVLIYIFKPTTTTLTSSFIQCNGNTCPTVVLPTTSTYAYFICRCPSRQLNYISGYSIGEIQIFNDAPIDSLRSTVYFYG